MIFSETWEAVLEGRKTQTRRVAKDGDELRYWDAYTPYVYSRGRRKWQVGRTYAIQPGRGKKALGRFLLTDIHKERLQEITIEDAVAEGCLYDTVGSFYHPDPIATFAFLWDTIHKPGERFADDPEVWILTMEVSDG